MLNIFGPQSTHCLAHALFYMYESDSCDIENNEKCHQFPTF